MIGKKEVSSSVRAFREPLRMGLTVMVLGAAALSLQAWLSNRHVWRTAGFVAATALTKAAIVLVLVLVVAGILVALRPKRTVQEALMVIAIANVFLGVVTSRPVLALAGAIGFAHPEVDTRPRPGLGHSRPRRRRQRTVPSLTFPRRRSAGSPG